MMHWAWECATHSSIRNILCYYNRSMINYLIVWKEDRCLLKDVKVILNEKCIPQHLLVIPMKPRKKKIVTFVLKLNVLKLKYEDTA